MRPFFRALSKPLITLSLIIDFSNSAKAPIRENMSFPVGVVLSWSRKIGQVAKVYSTG